MKTGDLVQFNSKKGLVKGPIIAVKLSRRGSSAARRLNTTLRLCGLHTAQVPESHTVYEIADFKRRMIWITANCEKIGTVSHEEVLSGRMLKVNMVNANCLFKSRSRAKNFEKVKEKSLMQLRRGDTIEVKYSDGAWRKETFHHFANSGKIAFSSSAARRGYRFAWPDFVRLPN